MILSPYPSPHVIRVQSVRRRIALVTQPAIWNYRGRTIFGVGISERMLLAAPAVVPWPHIGRSLQRVPRRRSPMRRGAESPYERAVRARDTSSGRPGRGRPSLHSREGADHDAMCVSRMAAGLLSPSTVMWRCPHKTEDLPPESDQVVHRSALGAPACPLTTW